VTEITFRRNEDGSYERVEVDALSRVVAAIEQRIKELQEEPQVEVVVLNETWPGSTRELGVLSAMRDVGYEPKMPSRFYGDFMPSDVDDVIRIGIDLALDTGDLEVMWAIAFKHEEYERVGATSWDGDWFAYIGPDYDWDDRARDRAMSGDGIDSGYSCWDYIDWEAWGGDICGSEYSIVETPDGTDVWRPDEW